MIALAALVPACAGGASAAPSHRASHAPRSASPPTTTVTARPAPEPAPDGPPPDLAVASEPPDWRAAYVDRQPIRTMRGRVSYYHDSLAGNSTASGEPYDPRAYTAASRDLPFGTVLRVVREDTGASAIVRVNDRGPFGRRRRLLDLSRAAAEELGMIERGVVEVRAEILELGPRPR